MKSLSRILHSVVLLREASNELEDLYPDISMTLMELAAVLVSKNNIEQYEIDGFENLVKETIEKSENTNGN